MNFRIFFILFASFFLVSNFSYAQLNTPVLPTVGKIAEQIENRRSDWTLFKAKLMLHFFQEDEAKASCFGQLSYDRIEEKIVLSCVGTQNKLLFIFKTFDRRFELYLPASQTVYEGNIFALNDSPDIDSHLKPLDLYRALKPFVIPLNEAFVERADKTHTGIKIYSKYHENRYVSRKLVATSEGDVPFEIYYSQKEMPVTVIRRQNYRRMPLSKDTKTKVVLPARIDIESVASKTRTMLLFKKVDFPARFEEQEMTYPENVQKVTIEDAALKSLT